jgi:high-affinity Fe2+/Pb2+ permease
MSEKLKNLKVKMSQLFKNGVIYGIIICAVAASFFVGIFYNQMTNKKESSKVQVKTIVKSEVNLAIDENNHLIVIEKKTGNYSI